MGDEPSFQSNSKPTSAVSSRHTCDSMLLNCLDAISPYLCNDPEHCFSVALTDCAWTGPWKAALTTSHPWANQKVVQNALLLQSCHLRGRTLRRKMGVCWIWPWRLHHPLRAMEDDTGEVGRTQRQVQSASENGSKRWPLEGEAWEPDSSKRCWLCTQYSQLSPICHQQTSEQRP